MMINFLSVQGMVGINVSGMININQGNSYGNNVVGGLSFGYDCIGQFVSNSLMLGQSGKQLNVGEDVGGV